MAHNHDNFVRAVFSTPEHAASLLGTFLGDEFISQFDLSKLTLVPGNFVDEDLRGHETDLLFALPSKDRPILVYVLMEHQSTPYAMMPIRLLRYVSNIYQSLGVENRSRRIVPEIIPLVLYNGERKWSMPTRLSDFYRGTSLAKCAGVRPAQIEFKLIDLSVIPDAKLQQEKEGTTKIATLTLLFLKHFRDSDFGVLLRKWAFFFKDAYREVKGEFFVQAAIWYILESTTVSYEDLVASVVPHTKPEMEAMIKTTGQKLREEGRKEGLEQGLEKGLEKGCKATAKALRMILVARFGELNAAQNRVIDGATLSELDIYLDRVDEVETLPEVLGN